MVFPITLPFTLKVKSKELGKSIWISSLVSKTYGILKKLSIFLINLQFSKYRHKYSEDYWVEQHSVTVDLLIRLTELWYPKFLLNSDVTIGLH